ncbi:MAG: ACP S-malonyltransferase [Microbacteriaceae bacterium]|nr:ACP S-malonyltransferase [Microbacteriaceae bacterium]
MTIVVTFPGQGSQKPGFLADWLESPQHRATLERLSEAAGTDLIAHGTESDADTIRDTAVAQPLIVAAGILVWDALRERAGDGLDGVAVAGHSVGEIAAAYAAGVFDAPTAIRFVARRAELMAADAAKRTTSMSAVLGGDADAVVARLDELGLEAANRNGAGQIVAAGEPAALDELRAEPPAGSRVIPLKVAGAFHTRWMADAHDALAADAEGFAVADPTRPLHTNADGSVVASGAEYRRLLVDQVNRPVRWDRCMEAFAAAGATGLIEAAPAGTLTGLAKRALKGIALVNLNSPADLDAAAELLAQAQ